MANEKKEVDINIVQVLDVAAKALHAGFLSGSRAHAKREFKKLKQGHRTQVATLNMGELKNAPLSIELDYSEYVGPGFGFDSFTSALRSMLRHTELAFAEKKDLNLLASEDQTELILGALPGIIQLGEQLNVMMMCLSFSEAPKIVVKLMFVEPDQFMATQKGTDADSA